MAKQIGRDDLFSDSFARIHRAVESAARAENRPVRAAAQVLVRAMKLELSHPGTGRVYVHGKHTHQASAPGDPPAPDTGTLRASISSGIVGDVMRVGTGLRYGADLEFGTEHILPRPWAEPALNTARREMGQVMVSELRSAVRGL